MRKILRNFLKNYVDGYTKVPTWKKVKDMTVYLYYWTPFNWIAATLVLLLIHWITGDIFSVIGAVITGLVVIFYLLSVTVKWLLFDPLPMSEKEKQDFQEKWEESLRKPTQFVVGVDPCHKPEIE